MHATFLLNKSIYKILTIMMNLRVVNYRKKEEEEEVISIMHLCKN